MAMKWAVQTQVYDQANLTAMRRATLRALGDDLIQQLPMNTEVKLRINLNVAYNTPDNGIPSWTVEAAAEWSEP